MPVIGTSIGLSIAAGATDLRLDPHQASNFVIEIEGLLVGGFASCTGLAVEIEDHEYREGGRNECVRHFAGRVKHPPLVLRHGMSPLDGLWNWHQDTARGRIRRRNGTVFLLNAQRIPVMWWDFSAGLPLKWTGPELQADKAAIAFESLEIVHEGLSRPRLARSVQDVAGEFSSVLELPDGAFF